MKHIRMWTAVAVSLLAQGALAQSSSSTSASTASNSSASNAGANNSTNTSSSSSMQNAVSGSNAANTNSQNNGSASSLNASFTIVTPTPPAVSSSTQSSVPADGVLKQNVTGETYTYGEQRTYVEYGGTQTIKNVPSIAAPPLASSNDTCMGSASGGLAVAGFGITGAGTYVDEHCKRIKMSRELWNKGMKAASLAMDCMDRDAREALELTGFVCPQTTRAQRQAEEAALKQARAGGILKVHVVSASPRVSAEEWAAPVAETPAPALPVAEAPAPAVPVAEAAPVATPTPVRIAPEPEPAPVAALPQEANVVIRRVDDGASRGLR